MEKLDDKKKSKSYDGLPTYITVNNADGELVAYIPLKPEAGLDDGPIVNKDYVCTVNYGDEGITFTDINGKIYSSDALTHLNRKQALKAVHND